MPFLLRGPVVLISAWMLPLSGLVMLICVWNFPIGPTEFGSPMHFASSVDGYPMKECARIKILSDTNISISLSLYMSSPCFGVKLTIELLCLLA